MLTCLKEVVGVTLSDCQCIIQGVDSETLAKLRASTSKLYMDDLEGGVHLKALNHVEACKTMSQMALNVRDNAIKRVEDDLLIAINNRYKKEHKNFNGQIGRMSYAQSLAVQRNWQGIRIRPNDYSDAVIRMSKLQIILNQAVTVTVRLMQVPLDSVMGIELFAWPVTTTANAYTDVPIGSDPISMPMMVKGELVEYYLLYDISEPGVPVMPKDTAVQCSTCPSGAVRFSEYISVWGVQLNNINSLNDKLTDQFSRGLILDVQISCDNETLMCREYNDEDAVALTMAYATWYKSGELLIEEVLKSPDVNRYTTMAREYLWGKRNHFRKEYESRIVYLASVIDVTASNCYVCRDTENQPFISPIFI